MTSSLEEVEEECEHKVPLPNKGGIFGERRGMCSSVLTMLKGKRGM